MVAMDNVRRTCSRVRTWWKRFGGRHGLDPDAVYTLVDLDVAGATETPGRELLEQGISIVMK